MCGNAWRYIWLSQLGKVVLYLIISVLYGLCRWCNGKEPICQCRIHKRLRKKWQHTPELLPGESHRYRSLVGYSPWGPKESDMTEHIHAHTHTYMQWVLVLLNIPEGTVPQNKSYLVQNVNSLWLRTSTSRVCLAELQSCVVQKGSSI